MKNKILIGSGVAAIIGIFTLGFKNCKRISRWFKNDLQRHRMEVGCICVRPGSYKICSKCYKCEECKTNHCKFCS